MSLVRLLCAGKALIGFREAPSAYRLRRAAQLPKFGGKGDPFAAPSAEKVSDPKMVPNDPLPSEARSAFWPGNWFAPKTGGDQLKRSSARLAMASEHEPVSAVQTELSLDNVKVVRNDLRSSDVDVVTRNGATNGLRFTAVKAEQALDRLADRIVGSRSG